MTSYKQGRTLVKIPEGGGGGGGGGEYLFLQTYLWLFSENFRGGGASAPLPQEGTTLTSQWSSQSAQLKLLLTHFWTTTSNH